MKLFQDMVHRDKNKIKETNPEKTNLLNKKHTEKKRRHYSGHRTKSDQKSMESSSSEIRHYKETDHHHEVEHEEYQRCRTQSLPFQGEKRESWWFCSDDKKTKNKEKKNDDTCSCVSCALKKLITSEATCVSCLAVLFFISVMIGILLIYKCMPVMTVPDQRNDRLKRKIEGINSWGSFLPKSLGLRTSTNYENQENTPNFNTLDSESDLSLIFDEGKLSDIASSARLRDFYRKLLKADAEIRRLKKNRNTNLGTNSNQWKYNYNVYPEREKRSIKLKNPFHMFHFRRNDKKTNEVTDKPKPITVIDNLHKSNNTRNKRLFNGTGDSIIFEKEQVLIYNPRKEKCSHSPTDSKSKSHEHELKHPFYKNTQRFEELLDQLNKNLPKLINDKFEFDPNTDDDKLLAKLPKIGEKATDRIIDKTEFDAVGKNDKSIEFDRFFDKFDRNVKEFKNDFDPVDKSDNSKMFKTDLAVDNQNEKPKPNFEILKDDKPKDYQSNLDSLDKNVNVKEYKTDFEIFRKMRNGSPNLEGTKTNGYADFDVPDLKREKVTTSRAYNVIMTISTIMIPKIDLTTPHYPIERLPNSRRLLQTDDDQEGIQYEDFKEVLTDDNVVHDEKDKQARRKRDEPNPDSDLRKFEQNKYRPPNINNPNWKGPMPLYPDEINSMIKKEPSNKESILARGIGKNVIAHGKQQALEDESDTDYMENYLDFRYNRLVNLAQAYSDYGVLESGKKYAVTDRQDKEKDKLNVVGVNDWKRSMKKRRYDNNVTKEIRTEENDGIKIHIGPDVDKSEISFNKKDPDDLSEILKLLDKQKKLSNEYLESVPSELLPVLVTSSYDQSNYRKPIAFTGMSGIPKQYNDYTKDIYGLSMRKNPEKSEDKILSPEIINHSTQNYKINDDVIFVKKRSLRSNTELNIDVDDKRKIENTNLLQRYFKSFRNTKDLNGMSDVNKDKMNDVHNDLKINEETVFKKRSLKSLNDFHDMSEANTEPNINDNKRKIDDKQQNFELLHEENNNINNMTEVLKRNNDQKMNSKILFKKRTLNSYNDSNDFYDISDEKPRDTNATSKRHADAFNKTTEVLSEFFGMLSQVFSKFDEFTEKMVVNYDSDSTPMPETSSDETVPHTSELVYAMYDSDMIENTGHRSRVLLAINSTDDSKLSSKSVEDNTAQLTELNLHLNSTSSTPRNIEGKSKNKTIVKRNAKNTIFWNDIYDDEYGVKTDMLDNLQEKSSKNDFIKRSNDWIEDKVRRFGGNIFRGYRRIKKSKPSDSLSRRVREADNDNQKTDFSALTVHMKEVCKKAASAVRESRQSDQDNKDSSLTNGLMKQLVGLMSDLIDYQVQQKTCMKLPQDLQNFLEWLTDESPDDQKDSEAEFLKPYSHEFTEIQPKEKSTGPPTDTTSEREQPIEDLRSDCLGTLNSVQELLEIYDAMLDEDKSKMTGVKDYLLNQMKFLRSLAPSEHFNKMNTDALSDVYRFKRQLDLKPLKGMRKHSRFIKNYSKKHTKTTVNFYDGPSFTDEFNRKKEKRNLRDIYYKALSDAKKTTHKNVHNG